MSESRRQLLDAMPATGVRADAAIARFPRRRYRSMGSARGKAAGFLDCESIRILTQVLSPYSSPLPPEALTTDDTTVAKR